MKLNLPFCLLAGALVMQTAGPAQARDLTMVWDIKQKCFRTAAPGGAGGDCGRSYNVGTRTFASAGAQKAGAAGADAKAQPLALASLPASTMLPESLRELVAAESAPKPDVDEKPASAAQAGVPAQAAAPAKAAAPAQAAAKAAPTQEEWDVASPPKKAKTEPKPATEAAAKTDAKKPVKSAESTERPRGIRKTKVDS